MKDFYYKVAVVTGAASGIGRALAEKSAALGMKVVLADVEESALKQAEAELQASGAQVLAVRTDVSQADEVEALAKDRKSTRLNSSHRTISYAVFCLKKKKKKRKKKQNKKKNNRKKKQKSNNKKYETII